MANASPERVRLAGRVAALTRHNPDAPETIEATRDLAAVKIEEFIRKIVENAPPLSESQREKLANLIRGGGR